jgi:hypothetical protein
MAVRKIQNRYFEIDNSENPGTVKNLWAIDKKLLMLMKKKVGDG